MTILQQDTTPKLHPAFYTFNTPAKPEDVNMIALVTLHLASSLSEVEVSLFQKDPLVDSVKGLIPASQRININRYFINLLMCFRASKSINVVDISQYLINDGSLEDWFKLFNEFIMPFLKEHKVFNIVYKF